MLSILIPSSNEPGIHSFIDEIEKLLPVHEIVVFNDKDRLGKGHALREAFNQSKGDIVAFLDGDGEIKARMLLRLLPFIEDFHAICGSKRITNSPLRRKIMTRLTRIWFKFLFGIKADTQTGIKLFRREALEAVGNWESNQWIFDVEILYYIQKKGMLIVEVPIECEIRRQLAVKTIFKILGESLWLKYRLLFRQK